MSFHPFVSIVTVVFFAVAWLALCGWGWWQLRRHGDRPVATWLTLLRRVLLGVVLTGALMGPSFPAEEVEMRSNVEIFIAVDRTGSMAAEDWQGDQPRLDGVRRDITSLVKATAGSRYAIVSWDSSSRLELPVTTDSSAVVSFAELLHQEVSEFSAGSSINRPLPTLEEALLSAKESRPENLRYLVIFSDGESTDESSLGVAPGWEALKSLIDGGAVVGYGTQEGGPMRIYQVGSGTSEEYMMDPDAPGTQAISQIDQETLQALGDILGTPVLVNPSDEDVAALGARLMTDASQVNDGRQIQSQYRYMVWPLGVAASALLLWELAAFAAKAVTLRRSNAI